MPANKKISAAYITGLVDGEGCFDLQFRRDVKRTRPGAPVYYSWKAQFVINLRKDDLPLLEQVRDYFQRGTIHFQTFLETETARYSIQDIESLYTFIVPFFRKHKLHGKKQKDFELWTEAIEILFKNKKRQIAEKGTRGFTPTVWQRTEFQRLIELQKEMQQYKSKRKNGVKWIAAAEAFALTLPESVDNSQNKNTEPE